jgi:dihydroorotase
VRHAVIEGALLDRCRGGIAVYDLILRDATLVSSRGRIVADVAVSDGQIAYVGPRPPREARAEVSAMGKFLIPGIVDTAVQFDPSGDPTVWECESRAAISGGVTTVVALPGGARPVVDRPSARQRLTTAEQASWCDFALWAAATDENPAEVAAAVREGLVAGALACVGEESHGISLDRLEAALCADGVFGLRIDEAASDTAATRRILEQVRDADRAVHLMHLSTADELQLVDPLRGDLDVTAGVTPHHLFLSIEESPFQVDTRPPVRGELDRRTLWTAVKRGRLDCVASDHHPYPQGSAPGVPGAEVLLSLMMSAVRQGRLSLESLVGLCCEGPARVMGLDRKGRIERGCDADLVLLSEGEVMRVDAESLVSGAGWSPYAQREVASKPEMVLLRGRIVASRGRVVADRPTGRRVTQPADA